MLWVRQGFCALYRWIWGRATGRAENTRHWSGLGLRPKVCKHALATRPSPPLDIADQIAPTQHAEQRRAIEHRQLLLATRQQCAKSLAGGHARRQRAQAVERSHGLADMREGPFAKLKAPQVAQRHHAKQWLRAVGIGQLKHRKALVDLAEHVAAHELIER